MHYFAYLSSFNLLNGAIDGTRYLHSKMAYLCTFLNALSSFVFFFVYFACAYQLIPSSSFNAFCNDLDKLIPFSLANS